MKKKKAPVVEAQAPAEPQVQQAEVVVEKKGIVNCPKCSTALHVKVGNIAYLCPVCSQMFRTRLGEKMVRDITRQTMMEAFITVDKDVDGNVNTRSIINDRQK